MLQIKNKASIDQEYCVACGCCVRVCPRKAIQVYKGLFSQVDCDLCIGCSKCQAECPASIIEITRAAL